MQIANPGPGGPAPDDAHAQALAERHRKRVQRRFAAWGAFLLLGLALGAIYASGFTTIGGATTGEATADPNNNQPTAKQDESTLASFVNPGSDFNYTWTGRWGKVPTTVTYELDLIGTDPVDEKALASEDRFFSEVVLVNAPAGFSDLQLQLRIAEIDEEKKCSDAEGEETVGGKALKETASSNHRVMFFESSDAQVSFFGLGAEEGGLKGAAKYCVGLVDYPAAGGKLESGKDPTGTFIRKSSAGSTPPSKYPEFVVTLNRMS